jgi:hypothetical protein
MGVFCMTTKTKVVKSEVKDKPKAQRLDLTQLVVDNAFARTFSTGSTGWFGRVTDPRTGTRYQIIGAVQLK